MEYSSQSSHGRIAQSCYHQEIPTDDPRSHSWSDNHLYYPNNNSSLITSPVEIHALPVLSQAPTWQNNPTNLSQDIHGFLDSRQTSHEPWTGHPRAMNHEQLWSHSFPGATAPMSDPGQDLHNTHQYNGASLISPADSAYQSFESTKSQPINHMQHHPFEHSSTPRYQTDSPQLQNFISGPTVAESVVSAPVVTTRGYQGSNSRQIGRNSRSRAAITPCSICHKVLKNPSDAQKHYFTHSKPFRCEVMGCTRQEGFATQNDLQRHRKAVHGLNPTVGKKTGYICAACGPSSAGGSPKFWPRRDNFKAHCNRKHKDWDEQLLLQQSEMHKSFDTISKSGYVSAPSQIDPFENLYSQEFSELMESNFPEQVAQQGDYTPFNFQNRSDDEELAGVGAGTSADPSLGNRASDAGLHDPSWKGRHGLLELSNAAESVGKLAGDMDHQTLRSPVGYDELSNLHISQQNLPNKDSTGQWTRSPQESSQGTTLSIEKSVPVAKHADGEFVCKHCKKRKKRECDLTKHLKRHSRPYGCTFPGCSKRFGSRNDWKRHENSQHFLQEMYHCVMMGLDGKPCNQHFGRKEAVVLHLQSPRHKIPPTEIEPEVELTRLGRNGHKRFWCGFCGKLVSSQGEPHRAWDYRSQHIGDHFDKEHMSIEQWMCMEENKFKGDIVPPPKKSGRRPQLRSVDAFEEDSDLGEDGIPEPVYVLSTIQTKQMSDHDDDDKEEEEEEEEVKFMSDDEDQFGAMNWDQ